MNQKENEADECLFGGRDHPNPLLNNLILSTVFKYLKEGDLLECRRVCKTWNVSTLTHTRNAFMITVSQETIETVVKVLRLNQLGIPYGKFQLGSFSTRDGVGAEFLSLCGPVTKEIQFSEGERDDILIEDFCEILKACSSQLELLEIPPNLSSRFRNVVKLFPEDSSQPKLTNLKRLTTVYDNRLKRNKFCPTFLRELMGVAQNITSFHLVDQLYYDNYESDDEEVEAAVNDNVEVEAPVNDNEEAEAAVNDNLEVEAPVNDNVEVEAPVNDDVEVEAPVNDNLEVEAPVNDDVDMEAPVNDNVEVEAPINDDIEVEAAVNDEDDDEEWEVEEVNMGSSLEVLSLIEEMGRESCVQDLVLQHERKDDSEYFELLHKMMAKPNGLNLKRLVYKTTTEFEPKTDNLFSLVSLFKDSLQVLETEGSAREDFTECLRMPHLVHASIQLTGNFSSNFVNLSEIFPVLRTLALRRQSQHLSVSLHAFDQFFPESEPCPNMNAFESDIVFHLSPFNQLLTVFPNLTELTVQVREDGAQILTQIWSHMTQLKSLDVRGEFESPNSVDSVLTGIPNPTLALQAISQAVDEVQQMPVAIDRRQRITQLKNQHSHLPSICNLTNLSSLTLSLIGDPGEKDTEVGKSCCRTCARSRRSTFLTNLTGYLALYSMECLRELKIEQCQLTKTCCELLAKDTGLQSFLNHQHNTQ